MLILLRGFLLLFLLYHVLVTTIGFGIFQGNFPQVPALIRDAIWILFVGLYFVSSLSSFRSYRKKWKNLRYTFFALLGTSVFFSYVQDKTVYDMFIGFKYGFYYIFLFLSATFIGYIFAKSKKKKDTLDHDNMINKFMNFFVWTLVGVVALGYVWQVAKVLFPDLFFGIGYGPLNDFQFGTKPPLYYLTGFGGTLRRQGIFSGPNNYGYFLVAFLPLILSYFKFSVSSWKDIFTKKMNLINLFVYILWFSAIIATLSRSAILGTVAVLLLININRWKRNRKVGVAILIIAFASLVGLSFLKGSSTLAHITAKFSSIGYVLKMPLGYGLGSSGPAIHHNGNILPENYFIQILIDIGLIGFAIMIGWHILCRKKIKSLFSDNFGKYVNAFTVGRIALLIMGIFLHVFEDSMVNYNFFIIFGFLGGYISNSKNSKQ